MNIIRKRQKWRKNNDRNKLGVSFRGIWDWKASLYLKILEFCFTQSTLLSHSASQKKDFFFFLKMLLLSFKGRSLTFAKHQQRYHTVINKYVKTNIKKEAIINCKSLWVTDLVLLDFIFSLQFRTHSLPFQLWIHNPMFSTTAWLSVTSNFPVPSRLSVMVKIVVCLVIKPHRFSVPPVLLPYSQILSASSCC